MGKKRVNAVRRLKSLVRERQRIWTIIYQKPAGFKIMVVKGPQGHIRTQLNGPNGFTHKILIEYLRFLDKKIDALTSIITSK